MITNPDGTVTVQEKVVSSVTVDPNDGHRVIKTFDNGFGIIHDTGGYTETHVIKAIGLRQLPAMSRKANRSAFSSSTKRTKAPSLVPPSTRPK